LTVNFAGETLLVTGFPGFHARKLALYLLQVEPEVKLVLLCRASDRERSAECLARLEPAERARVRELIADPAALDFGLSGAEYLELAASVQRVYHFASSFDGKPRTEAAAHNVACAREVLEFTQAARELRGLVLLSSVTVCGTRTGPIREDELSCGQTFRRRLDESLATVESMCARRTHLPQIVLRPSKIVGDSHTKSTVRGFRTRGSRSSLAVRANSSCPSHIDRRRPCKSYRSISWCAQRISSARAPKRTASVTTWWIRSRRR
jgi:thioester reductase-like protein